MEIIYLGVLIVTAAVGAWGFTGLIGTGSVRRRKLLHSGEDSSVTISAGSTDIKIPHYKTIRFIAVAALAAYNLIFYLTAHKPSVEAAVLLVAVILLSNPHSKLSLVQLVVRRSQRHRRAMKDKEIYRAIIQLMNISALDLRINATETMELLMRHMEYLREDFARLQRTWNVSDKAAAIEEFVLAAGGDRARDFGKLLLKLDTSYPGELNNELELYQQTILETKQTEREKNDARTGDLFFALVSALFMLILVNFVVVVVFSNISLNFAG